MVQNELMAPAHEMQIALRIATYGTMATKLALLSDQRLLELLETDISVGASIGGATSLLKVNDVSVFVKRVTLTDIERRPENISSTANFFELPTYCQYGIGSPGFGVWRELAAHTMSTSWVLTGECPNFPLMYHWRVLPRSAPVSLDAEKLTQMEQSVMFWEGSSAMRTRLLAQLNATTDVVFFLEYIPENLHQWLRNQIAQGGIAAETACVRVANKLKAITTFINSQELLHFDAHFKNILTDGQELFFADFGLAICDKFELSKAESDFFKLHYGYDQYYTMAYLVQMWVRTQTFGAEISNWFAGDYSAALHEYDTGKRKSLPTAIAAYLPIAVLMNTFFEKLKKSKTASYPAEELERAYATAEFFAMNSANKELS